MTHTGSRDMARRHCAFLHAIEDSALVERIVRGHVHVDEFSVTSVNGRTRFVIDHIDAACIELAVIRRLEHACSGHESPRG